jgi:hypothetical protein
VIFEFRLLWQSGVWSTLETEQEIADWNDWAPEVCNVDISVCKSEIFASHGCVFRFGTD